MEEKRIVNLEEILKSHNPRLNKDGSDFKLCVMAMKEACKQTLELAAENAELLKNGENIGVLFELDAYDFSYNFFEITPDKQSILNTINQTKSNNSMDANMLDDKTKTKSYFLCSENVIKAFPDYEHSKPFKDGYGYNDEKYYIAILDFDAIERYHTEDMDNFWCRECVPGQIDVSHITITGMRRNGVLCEIYNKTNLSQEKNIAMAIYNLSEKYKCSPIELINKIK